MEKRVLTCIGCPLGCAVTVESLEKISGYTCKRGLEYARKEVTNPARTVTSTVRVTGSSVPVVSVRTATDVPKDAIWKVMEAINTLKVSAPVRIGDVLAEDIAGMGVALVATKSADPE